jgi:hypothetical protein
MDDEVPQVEHISVTIGPPRWLQWVVFLGTIGIIVLTSDRLWTPVLPILPIWVGRVALVAGAGFFVVSALYVRWKARQIRQWMAQPTPTDTLDDVGL